MASETVPGVSAAARRVGKADGNHPVNRIIHPVHQPRPAEAMPGASRWGLTTMVIAAIGLVCVAGPSPASAQNNRQQPAHWLGKGTHWLNTPEPIEPRALR